ncbi:MAG TPA: hypothetical protein VGL65_10575 [Gemmatimonadales bacterium]|jgi:hypothetical protein
MTATGDKAYDRVFALLEELPTTSAVMMLRQQILRQAGVARARHDTARLEKLYRETQALARSLGVGLGGKISRLRPAVPTSSPCICRTGLLRLQLTWTNHRPTSSPRLRDC